MKDGEMMRYGGGFGLEFLENKIVGEVGSRMMCWVGGGDGIICNGWNYIIVGK